LIGGFTMAEARESWGSKLGLILAMAGNAIGLGNFWRFPYMAAENGGGAFMFPYFLCILIVALPVMFVEWNLGREGGKYGHGTLGPMIYLQTREGISPKKAAIYSAIVGGITFSVPLLVDAYYIHIVGWSLGYSFLSLTGNYMVGGSTSTAAAFCNYISDPVMVFVFWGIALACLAFVAWRGIEKGIEAWAKVMMPALYVLAFILIFKVFTIGTPVNPDWTPLAGLNFLWNPDFSQITFSTFLAACGQVFFSLSIGMGIICNYASYLKPEDDITLSGISTVSLNEFAEVILGGTLVIPIAYVFGGAEGMSAGPGLAFINLPNIFIQMGSEQFFGTLWFLILFFAGFTSAIALFNYVVTIMHEDFGFAKGKASLTAMILFVLVGFPVALEGLLAPGTGQTFYLDELDGWVCSYLVIFVGLAELIGVTWLSKNSLDKINYAGQFKIPAWYYNVFMKVLAPLFLLVVIIGATKDKIVAGYFKIVPSFLDPAKVVNFDGTVLFVNGARLLIIAVIAFGIVHSYKTLKKHYGKEIAENKVSIIKEA